MDLGRIMKWVVLAVLLFVVWKYVVPWAKNEMGGSKLARVSAAGGSGDLSCARAAERASDYWGRSLSRFMNPPYDVDTWSTFRSDVDAKIAEASAQCSCQEKPCESVRDALNDLRMLVSQFDSAIRSGSSIPEDAVQRQESIDNRIAMAREGS